MPTYEYACAACGHQWEQVQRITEPAVELCPSCSKSSAHRLISGGTNFILKGGGWYSDLYASPKAENKKSDAKSGSTSEVGGKAESAAPAAGASAAAPAASTPSPAASPTPGSSSPTPASST